MADILLRELRDYLANKPITATLQNAATANGNGTDFVVDGYGVASLQVTGTFSATVEFWGSVDGVNFVQIVAINKNTGQSVFSTQSPGIFQIDCRGLQKIRAKISGYTSGSVTVVGRAEPFAGSDKRIELTGSNIPDAQAVPTKVMNCNVANNYLQNVTITPGSSVGTGDLDFNGTRLGIGIRLASGSRKFKVRALPKQYNASVALGTEDIIDSSATASDRGVATYTLKSKRNTIDVFNADTSDITVTILTITDFTA